MNMRTLLVTCLACSPVAIVAPASGCGSDDAPGTHGTDTEAGTDGTDTTTGTPSTATTPGSQTQTATDSQGPSTTATPTASTTQTQTGSTTETDTDTDGPNVDPTVFIFRDDPLERYAQVDRMGAPGVNAIFIPPESKDAYNQSPDGMGFGSEMRDTIALLHVGPVGLEDDDNTGLNDDLTDRGMTPCEHTAGFGEVSECAEQVAPLMSPDVIRVSLLDAPSFPNSRRPSSLVMDPILAATLLSFTSHDYGSFIDLEMNPTANDVEFPLGFPYLAPAHE